MKAKTIMNPQQYPQQPGQMPPGYPGPTGQPGPYPPQQNPGQPWQPGMPPAPGQYAQPGQPGPYPPQGPQPMQQPIMPTTGYNPYAYPGEYDKPKAKGPNKAILIGGVALLVVIALIAVVVAGSSSSNQGASTQTDTQQETTSDAGKDVIPRSDATLDLSKKIVSSETLKAQTIKAKTSEQVNLSSGFSFMVTKTEAYVSPNPTTLPGEGKQFIAVTTVVGNRNQSVNISVSYLDFRLRDASNQLLAPSTITNEVINNPLASPSELKPGEQITGTVIYEVDADEANWVFKHTETYQKTTDDTTFTVEGEIAVQLAGANESEETSLTDGAVQGEIEQPTPQSPTPAAN